MSLTMSQDLEWKGWEFGKILQGNTIALSDRGLRPRCFPRGSSKLLSGLLVCLCVYHSSGLADEELQNWEMEWTDQSN